MSDSDTYPRSAVDLQRRPHEGQERWLALSAYAFQTEVVHGQEGYTILRLPGNEVAEENNAPGKVAEKLAEQPAKEFVLWEVVRGSGGC